MAEFFELVGPDAVRNFLQNWPFAAVVIGCMWFLFRQLTHCYAVLEYINRVLLEREIDE